MKTTAKEQKDAIREKVLRLHDQGKKSEEIAQLLKVKQTTVMAWMAHNTRGTYSG